MHTQIDKTQTSKSRAVANAVAPKQRSGNPVSPFVDNRREVVAQRRWQAMADNSLKMQQGDGPLAPPLQRRALLKNAPPNAEEDKPKGGDKTGNQLPAGRYPADVMKKFYGDSDTQRYTDKGYPHLSIVFAHQGPGIVSLGQGCHYSISNRDNCPVDMNSGTYAGGATPQGYPTAEALLAIVTSARRILEESRDRYNQKEQRRATVKKVGRLQSTTNTTAKEIYSKVLGLNVVGADDWPIQEFQNAAQNGWTAKEVEKSWNIIKDGGGTKPEKVTQLSAITSVPPLRPA